MGATLSESIVEHIITNLCFCTVIFSGHNIKQHYRKQIFLDRLVLLCFKNMSETSVFAKFFSKKNVGNSRFCIVLCGYVQTACGKLMFLPSFVFRLWVYSFIGNQRVGEQIFFCTFLFERNSFSGSSFEWNIVLVKESFGKIFFWVKHSVKIFFSFPTFPVKTLFNNVTIAKTVLVKQRFWRNNVLVQNQFLWNFFFIAKSVLVNQY